MYYCQEIHDCKKLIYCDQDIIISSLPNAQAVKTVFLDASTGLLAGCAKSSKKLFLETSTIEASTSLEVLQEVNQTCPSSVFLDAPVSGGIPPAHAGTLTFMVGGSDDAFERARPVMATMGKAENLIHCGGPGAGLATKQINNYVAYCSYVALCEGELRLRLSECLLILDRHEHGSEVWPGSKSPQWCVGIVLVEWLRTTSADFRFQTLSTPAQAKAGTRCT